MRIRNYGRREKDGHCEMRDQLTRDKTTFSALNHAVSPVGTTALRADMLAQLSPVAVKERSNISAGRCRSALSTPRELTQRVRTRWANGPIPSADSPWNRVARAINMLQPDRPLTCQFCPIRCCRFYEFCPFLFVAANSSTVFLQLPAGLTCTRWPPKRPKHYVFFLRTTTLKPRNLPVVTDWSPKPTLNNVCLGS